MTEPCRQPFAPRGARPTAPYESRYDPDQVPTGVRRALLERTPPGALVLDIGCWSGYMGRFLTAERNAVVDGVEPEARMARLAAARYRNVYVGSIERALLDLLPERRGCYETLLLLDVLEHLVDPWSVLASCRALLREGGHALLSIPNVAHWSVRKTLLLGRWTYEDSGLLDHTHLRFFTRATAGELVAGAGWRVVWARPSVGQPPGLRLPDRGLRILERWPSLFAVQFLLEVEPANRGA